MRFLAQEFRTPLVDSNGQIVSVWQQRLAKLVGLNGLTSRIATLDGNLVVGGDTPPPGGEPLSLIGSAAGLSLNDRAGGSNPRWIIYADNGSLRLWNATDGDLVTLAVGGSPFLTAETALPGFDTLTDSVTVTWDFQNYKSRKAYLAIGGNRTLNIPNCPDGAEGELHIEQTIGGNSIILPATSKVAGGGAGVIDLSGSAAGQIDILPFSKRGSVFYWAKLENFT